MTKDNVKLMDLDEHQRDVREACIPADIIAFAEKYNLTVDLATSDVCTYLEDCMGNSIGLG